jgi:UDP-N-acetylmuramyl pentapeptide synthase
VRAFGEDDRNALIEDLENELGSGDVVLVKGSRGLVMEEIVAALRTDAGGCATEAGE